VPAFEFLNVRARDEFTIFDGVETSAPVLLSCGGACASAEQSAASPSSPKRQP
jgi:hypothetical protein